MRTLLPHLSTERQRQKLAFYHSQHQDMQPVPFRSAPRIRIGYVLSNKGSCCYSKLPSTFLTQGIDYMPEPLPPPGESAEKWQH